MYAGFGISRAQDSIDKKGETTFSWFVEECGDENCGSANWSTFDNSNDPDWSFPIIKGNKVKTPLCIGYDQGNHEVVFSYNGQTEVVNNGDHDLPAFGDSVHPDRKWVTFEVRADPENCTAGRVDVYSEGTFDDIQLYRLP